MGDLTVGVGAHTEAATLRVDLAGDYSAGGDGELREHHRLLRRAVLRCEETPDTTAKISSVRAGNVINMRRTVHEEDGAIGRPDVRVQRPRIEVNPDAAESAGVERRAVHPNREEGIELSLGADGVECSVGRADIRAEGRRDLVGLSTTHHTGKIRIRSSSHDSDSHGEEVLAYRRDHERVVLIAVQRIHIARHTGIESHSDLVGRVAADAGG